MKKIAILGGSGFVGQYIVEKLFDSGFDVKLISRKKSHSHKDKRAKEVIVDLYSKDLLQALKGSDCVIFNIGIIREFHKKGILFKKIHQDLAIHTINMAEKANVKKFILMSANDIDLMRTPYERTKRKAEEHLIQSNLDWTIFRPSIIFGNPKGKMEFCTQVKRDMVMMPLPLPIFFSGFNFLKAGSFKMSPIHVNNVAEFFVKSINSKNSNYQIYSLGGTKNYTWIEMLKAIAFASGNRKFSIPVPFSLLKILSFFLDQFNWFPVTRDQLVMLQDGNTCESSKYFSEFNIDEIPFNQNSLSYLS